MILSRKQRRSSEHLREDTPNTPDIHLHSVSLPRQHNFWRSVVSRGNVAGHLGFSDASEAEVANLQVAVLVDEKIAGFQVTVHDARRMEIFESALLSLVRTNPFLVLFAPVFATPLDKTDNRTKIWYMKYCVNLPSRGLACNSRPRSVPKSSVTR